MRTIAVAAMSEKDSSATVVVQPCVEFSFHGSPRRAKQSKLNFYRISSLSAKWIMFWSLEIVEYYLERHDPQTTFTLERSAPVKGSTFIPGGGSPSRSGL